MHLGSVDLLGHLELMEVQAKEENVAVLDPRVTVVQRYGIIIMSNIPEHL